jgi:glucose/arabinose dehydrogenase
LFLPDRSLLISIGDGGNPPISFDGDLIRNQAQKLSAHFGKVVRVPPDGAPPADNPWISNHAAQNQVWTIGHRNIQGLAYDPVREEVLASEHGPRGGDEINVLRAGANYGWPKVTYGVEYSGRAIAAPQHGPPYSAPLLAWAPSIAPSGLVVYRGSRFPEWHGNVFSGGLVSADVRMIERDESGAAVRQHSLPIGARVRDVREGPDGYLYVLTDEPRGRLLRISPGRT